ncbi:beta-glucosidase BglX [Vallitalea okinawensis]|uniref:beta-glucosidase BglX n=1 Tax=Vallitalea okinawensis TaxID=2078660 RepID=UPI000CFD520A|nr:beta-glucosidase BglX [Vallitalea okinawensis]
MRDMNQFSRKKVYEEKQKYPNVIKTRSNEEIEEMIDDLLQKMTLREKIGQMYQMVRGANPFGSKLVERSFEESVKNGDTGITLGIKGWENTFKYQKMAVEESRLGIPLLFNADIIHGCDTIYPVPLGFACSFDMEAVEKAARMAAIEATAAGVHWNNSPMIDVSRDPRWGRCTEGVGEDPYLGQELAKAQIKGYQSNENGKRHYMMACAKHFVAYGASDGGRDYNTVSISERDLRETYLPPFKAAVDEGVDSIMPAFTTYSNTPATANQYLLKNILRDEYDFDGIVLTDYTAVTELIAHGAAKDEEEAARLSIDSTVDVEMVSDCFLNSIESLVVKGQLSVDQIETSVRRVLRAKIKLGLFDNPYFYIDPDLEDKLKLNPQHREIAHELAQKSMVLLKNDPYKGKKILPLDKNIKSIALIGPLVEEKKIEGAWAFVKDRDSIVTLEEGIKNKLSKECKIYKSKGCSADGSDLETAEESIRDAVNEAKKADIILLALGEVKEMSGEAKSYSRIGLPGAQRRLAEEIMKLGKPTALVVFNGRPVILDWYDQNIPAILEAWFPGTEGGNAVASVLFGEYNPSGKLSMSFPYCEGQIPVFYRRLKTGRPHEDKPEDRFRSKYEDVSNHPLYCFGHGLSYTEFQYSEIVLSHQELIKDGSITASIEVTNRGDVKGTETVQLYIRDLHSYGLSRPVKELKSYQQITLNPKEKAKVEFVINEEMVKFYDRNMKYTTEKGVFELYIGTSSDNNQKARFEYV